MTEFLYLLILFGLGLIAGIINVNAGGGSTLTLPVLIFLGLDAAMANGTNRIAILLQNVFAVSSFHRQKMHNFKKSIMLALFTLPGAITGAILAVKISNESFQRVLAFVMFGIVVTMFFSRSNEKYQHNATKTSWLVYPALFIIGFYGGFIQLGVGFLLMAALYHLLKISLVHVNMHKVFIVLLYTLPALGIFIWTGNVNWGYGFSLAAGTSFGAWWGARIAVKGGEKVIRYFLAIAIILMAVKLLGVF